MHEAGMKTFVVLY